MTPQTHSLRICKTVILLKEHAIGTAGMAEDLTTGATMMAAEEYRELGRTTSARHNFNVRNLPKEQGQTMSTTNYNFKQYKYTRHIITCDKISL